MTNIKLQKYQNKSKLKDVYPQNNLSSSVEYRGYVLNLDKYKSIGTHWIALYENYNSVTYFDSFGVGHTLEEIKRFINNNNIITNIFKKQAYDSIISFALDTFPLDILILCSDANAWQILQIYSCHKISKKNNEEPILDFF